VGDYLCLMDVACLHAVLIAVTFVLLFCLFSVLRVISSYIKSMYSHHAALWSSDPYYSFSSEGDSRDRITHHQRTKQRGNGQQQPSQDSWTWEEILDGKGQL
jgi:hypothetical protein